MIELGKFKETVKEKWQIKHSLFGFLEMNLLR
jgi:predicted transposase YbfD/YdcC